jgi:hypothetical protein
VPVEFVLLGYPILDTVPLPDGTEEETDGDNIAGETQDIS